MAKMSSGPQGPRPSAENDVYTVLLCVSSLALLAAVIFVGYSAIISFGSFLPPGGG